MALQYNLDHGANLGSFADFVHAQHYTDAFEQALLASKVDVTGSTKAVDLLNLDTYGENFKSGFGYDAAYLANQTAADSTNNTILDSAKVILFNGDIDGVMLNLAGSQSHVIGATAGDDKIIVSGWNSQTVDGAGGNDYIQTGNGNDVVFGGDGHDTIMTGRGDDTVYGGGDGGDRIFTDRGDDSILGGGGDNTIDGGTGFDIATVDATKASFHYVGNQWVSSENGDAISNVEYVEASDGVLITVQNVGEAAVARLFQAVNDQDPTAGDYHDALMAFHNGASLEEIATSIDGIDGDLDLTGPALTSHADKAAFVSDVMDNLFDTSAGKWSAAQISSYVDGIGDWSKAKIVADLVTHVSTADEHIGIHIDATTV
jgi:Ca2+-binding RTX toxin-like protein